MVQLAHWSGKENLINSKIQIQIQNFIIHSKCMKWKYVFWVTRIPQWRQGQGMWGILTDLFKLPLLSRKTPQTLFCPSTCFPVQLYNLGQPTVQQHVPEENPDLQSYRSRQQHPESSPERMLAPTSWDFDVNKNLFQYKLKLKWAHLQACGLHAVSSPTIVWLTRMSSATSLWLTRGELTNKLVAYTRWAHQQACGLHAVSSPTSVWLTRGEFSYKLEAYTQWAHLQACGLHAVSSPTSLWFTRGELTNNRVAYTRWAHTTIVWLTRGELTKNRVVYTRWSHLQACGLHAVSSPTNLWLLNNFLYTVRSKGLRIWRAFKQTNKICWRTGRRLTLPW